MTYRKKLIEVSLPLEAINEESAREKSIRHGHPSTLHLWWARRPLAACRAVLWSSLVDDPSEYMPDEESANRERDRLFAILEKLVLWENINNEDVLDAAKLEIVRSMVRDLGCEMPVGKTAIREFLVTKVPPVLDPFAGGGSIPLEAQRLGLRAYASDLNPVAVLINKALIEIPPKFAGLPPIHPKESIQEQGTFFNKEWKRAEGLAEDVRYYGKWMRDEAEKRIGHIYPKVKITAEILAVREDLRQQGLIPGQEFTAIAWLWARTVKCPNPACGCQMPLVRSFALCTKANKKTWIQVIPPSDKEANKKVKFVVRIGNEIVQEGTVNRNGARCLICGIPVPLTHIRSEGQADRLNSQLLAIVLDGPKGRIYISPLEDHEKTPDILRPDWQPEGEFPLKHRNFQTPNYGMKTIGSLFTDRQLVALTTFSNLVEEAKNQVLKDGRVFSHQNLLDYANSISTYLALNVSRLSNRCSTACFWDTGGEKIQQVFARQAIPMTWDYVEGNPFSSSTGNFMGQIDYLCSVIENSPNTIQGFASQRDIVSQGLAVNNPMISTDPPYYDNINYADLSDYFYVWLRKCLSKIYPDLFATVLVPKSQELIASPYRHNGDKEKAKSFFETGLRNAFKTFFENGDIRLPVTIFYAFKQTETEDELDKNSQNRVSTGWETMLEALISNHYQITGTWPMRTEFEVGLKKNMNALASSVVLVCRRQETDARAISLRELNAELKRELPIAFHQLQLGNIAPVDLAQAAIGPGMAIFSRYKAVLEADGSQMPVRAALGFINQGLDEYLAEQEGEYDSDTRWALAWFEQYGNDQGPYGLAETLSKAKNTSVEGLSHAGFLEARAGKVRLLKRDELDENWDPSKDKRLTSWEVVQYLIRSLDLDGEKGAGALLGKLGSYGGTARDLAYRLYTICERKGWAQEALVYNMLVVAWPRIKEQSGKGPRQESLL